MAARKRERVGELSLAQIKRKRKRVGELSLAQVKKFQANQARKAADKMGAEGPKRSTPRTARTRKK